MNSATIDAGSVPYRTRTPGLPLLVLLMSFPVAFFVGALLTDIAYAYTADFVWMNFSAWLLAGAMAGGVVAAIVGLVVLIASRRRRPRPRAGAFALGGLLVLAVGLVDNLVHSRDGWTSVVPLGLALSALTVVLILVTFWLGAAANARPEPLTSRPGVRP